jgi:hypothetical protein
MAFWLEAVFGIPYGARDKVPRHLDRRGGVSMMDCY